MTNYNLFLSLHIAMNLVHLHVALIHERIIDSVSTSPSRHNALK